MAKLECGDSEWWKQKKPWRSTTYCMKMNYEYSGLRMRCERVAGLSTFGQLLINFFVGRARGRRRRRRRKRQERSVSIRGSRARIVSDVYLDRLWNHLLPPHLCSHPQACLCFCCSSNLTGQFSTREGEKIFPALGFCFSLLSEERNLAPVRFLRLPLSVVV